MKKILLSVLTCFVIALAANGQEKKPEWITIKSANLRCWECKDRLESYLLREKANTDNGLLQWKINLLQGEIRVQFLPSRTTAQVIRVALNNAGFDADTEKAEPDAYKTLPAACKLPAEGGGPQNGKPCHIKPI